MTSVPPPIATLNAWVPVFKFTFKAHKIVTHGFENDMMEVLDTIGDVHFKKAKRALKECLKETKKKGVRELMREAEGGFRDAFGFFSEALDKHYDHPLDPFFPKARKISAHYNAYQAALAVAAVNCELKTYETAKDWMTDARSHFGHYERLTDRAARNGANLQLINDVMERYAYKPHGAEGTAPAGGWQALKKREAHKQRQRILLQEREIFDKRICDPTLAAIRDMLDQ